MILRISFQKCLFFTVLCFLGINAEEVLTDAKPLQEPSTCFLPSQDTQTPGLNTKPIRKKKAKKKNDDLELRTAATCAALALTAAGLGLGLNRLNIYRGECEFDQCYAIQNVAAFNSIDAIMTSAVRSSKPFDRKVPSVPSSKHYPQLLFETLGKTEVRVIDDLINGEVGSDVKADRSLGALMGLVIGDSVGAPLEFLPATSNKSYLTTDDADDLNYSTKDSRFNLKRGQWTDDSSMALCLADSLIVSGLRPTIDAPSATLGEYDGSDCRIRYYLWWHRGYNNAFIHDDGRDSVGLGGNISKSLTNVEINANNVSDTFDDGGNASGNGSIMRNSPVAIRFSSDIFNGINVAMQQSKGTHPGEDAAVCCAFLTFITIKAINREREQTIQKFVDEAIQSFLDEWVASTQKSASPTLQASLAKLILVLSSNAPQGTEALWNWKADKLAVEETLTARGDYYNGWRNYAGYLGSYCMDGLAMALWALYHSNSFVEAIIKCVNLCGDADSTGAICGQMAGAFYGYSSILASTTGNTMISNVNRWDPKREISLRALMLYHLSIRGH